MIIALLFLILFAILFPKALRFLFALLFIGGIVALGEVRATPRESTGQLIMSYEPTKARCIKYGNGAALNYDAGDRGERDCEDLGYIIKTLNNDGCRYSHNHWQCY